MHRWNYREAKHKQKAKYGFFAALRMTNKSGVDYS
jgi:hypothetical protein